MAIQSRANAGSYYFNYKGYHSLVLLAMVDARGKFMYIDDGANGSCSDAGIFKVTHQRAGSTSTLVVIVPHLCDSHNGRSIIVVFVVYSVCYCVMVVELVMSNTWRHHDISSLSCFTRLDFVSFE